MDDLRQFVEETLRARDIGALDEYQAACDISRRLCSEIDCDRASICKLEGSRIVRVGGFDRQTGLPLPPQVELSSKSATAHHVADRRMGVYPSIESDGHDWSDEQRKQYLEPSGIKSLKVSAIGRNPKVTGFVCAASLTDRVWTLAEAAKLRVVANTISLKHSRAASART